MATKQEFNFSVDLLRAILWQYNTAERLQTILERKSDWYEINQNLFWQNWYSDVFNLLTANDFGLSVWARILNIPLVATIPSSGDRPVWGFGANNLNFFPGNAPDQFPNFGLDEDGVLSLTTEQKRLVLRLRWFQLTTRGAVTEINRVLADVFRPYGLVYVLDGLDMSANYIFTFVPDQRLRQVLANFDVLPRPAGVQIATLILPRDSFGFDPYYLNFNNSNFGGY